MKQIPDSFKDLLDDKTAAPAYLATLMPDGTPQLTPVWFDSDGEYLYISSAQGRVKDRNVRARPQIALVIQDPQDVNRYIQVRGKVIQISEDRTLEQADRLSMKYRKHHWEPVKGQVRVTYKIAPASISVDS